MTNDVFDTFYRTAAAKALADKLEELNGCGWAGISLLERAEIVAALESQLVPHAVH